MRNITVQIQPHFCIMVALSVFVLPVPVILGWIVAAVVHEICHLIMIILLKLQVHAIGIRATGAVIKTEPMSPMHELCCSLAGPIGALFLLVFIKVVPYIALSAVIQSAFNLLPVYPLDGGRAVKGVVSCFAGEETAHKVVSILSATVIILVAAGGIYFSLIYRLKMLPMIIPAVLLIGNVLKNSLQRERNNCTI